MDPAGQLLREDSVDQPLAVDPRLPLEGPGDDLDAKMTFAFRPRADMAGVQMGLVNDLKPRGSEARGQLPANLVGHAHVRSPG